MIGDEPLAGTASIVERWVLVEDPGPWGIDALAENSLPPSVFGELRTWARRMSARVILIRRGARVVSGSRHVYVARSTLGAELIGEWRFDEVPELISGSFDDALGGSGRRREILFLVCTHGKHDRCCSVKGNAVSRTMCGAFPESAWECSHIGGDRFAANLVCLPHGVYFGRVPVERAAEIAARYLAGHLDLDTYRGRSLWPFSVQAAEVAVRKELGLTRVGDLVPVEWERGDSSVDVTMSAPGGSLVATVRIGKREPSFLTCRSEQEDRAHLFETTLRRRDGQGEQS